MMMTRSSSRILLSLTAALWLVGAAAPAQAQSFVAPFIGFDFGGDAQCPQITDCEDKTLNGGLALGHMGAIFGFEEEFAYAKDFFGKTPDYSSSVLTVMSSAMLTPRLRPIRPYFLVGMGLIKTNVDFNADSLLTNHNNSLGWNIGGGVMIGTKHVAVRGDVRFFHALMGPDILGFTIADNKLDFGRACAGLVFGF
jgi:opacity protein-like surface antigen